MANDKNFKVKNGLVAGRYLLSSGTTTSGTQGYSLVDASYDSVSFNVLTEESAPLDVFFKPDGSKMYVMGSTGDDVNEYDLSENWNIETASFSRLFSVAGQETAPNGLFFKPDGSKMYVVGTTDFVYEYDLGTNWNVETASLLQSFDVDDQETSPTSIFFKPDGTKMYITGIVSDAVNEYILGTPWDVSTAVFLQELSVISATPSVQGVFFNPDGYKMFIVGNSSDAVHEYELSTAWDVSTAGYVRKFSVAVQENNVRGVTFKSDGTKMYIVGASRNVYQYSTAVATEILDLSTGNTFSFTPSSATAIVFANEPPSDVGVGFTLETNSDYEYSISWPPSVKWNAGVAPAATASKDLYAFVTIDGGTTYYGRKAAEGLA